LLLRQLAACRGYGSERSSPAPLVSTGRIEDSVPKAKNARPIRILLAEDNVVNQKVALAMLLRMGHEVTIVNNGLEALEEVQKKEFDVVLMDIHMPEMDGLEALKNIRKLGGAVAGIPVIALTANAMKGDREKYLVAGMDEYVPKPIDTNLLSETLSKVTGIETSATANQARHTDGRREDLAQDAARILNDLDDILEG
jgi:CheY-like chemotaxis protein